ncbi:hypothetical protein BJV82DRAFT_111089 [Fennellomyces sp. T-0311]|nr:hypothetical protein BJV82DRAFT_111089 [Fennellomyces sp. T-0311]
MYIVYERNQREIADILDASLHDYGTRIPGMLCDNEHKFKPTWLVRVSDMEVVPGSTVDGHYWTLSYSWNQSGEIVHKGDEEYERIDHGKHQIIENGMDATKESRSVTFKGLVQQICLDFGAEYIWLDQMCIDQDDHDAKVYEIQRMHLIYMHACATLALVPELVYTGDKDDDGNDIANINGIPNSQWSKRIWTLEEAYLSLDTRYIGSNVHLYPRHTCGMDGSVLSDFIKCFTRPLGRNHYWKAHTALHHAKRRTTSKAHDQIFALANIFSELKNGITFNYHQPVRVLMIQFYTLLAQNDLSILLFGAPIDPETNDQVSKTIQKEAATLPSWTGVNGIHIANPDRVHNLGVQLYSCLRRKAHLG